MRIVANFIGGPTRSNYGEQMNVQASIIDYLVYKLFGANAAVKRLSKKYNHNFSGDYFKEITFYA